MKVKELVLGICALAVVTGGAPQMFGSVLNALKPIVLKGKDGILSDDGGRQAEYVKTLRLTGEKVDEHNRMLAKMRRDEIENVEEALKCDHYVYLGLRRAAIKLEEACKKVASTRQELELAKGEPDNASLIAKGETSAEVQALELRLAAESKEKELVEQAYREENDTADRYLNAAQEARARACKLRKQRIASFTKFNLVNTYIEHFGGDDCLETARRGLEYSNCNIEEKEWVRVNALAALIFWASDDGSVEGRVVERIKDIIQSHTDHRWVNYVLSGDDDVQLLEMLQKEYVPPKIGYDYKDTDPFDRQIARINAVFGGANKLQGDTRLHWEGEDDYRAA
jgi:hypothetical protein